MAENKTKPTSASVRAFLDAVDDPQQRADARKVAAMMRRATGKRARMWGSSVYILAGFRRFEQLVTESVNYMRANYETW